MDLGWAAARLPRREERQAAVRDVEMRRTNGDEERRRVGPYVHIHQRRPVQGHEEVGRRVALLRQRGANRDAAAGRESHDAHPRRVDAPRCGVAANQPQGLLCIRDAHAQHLGQPGVIGLGIGVAVPDSHLLPWCGDRGTGGRWGAPAAGRLRGRRLQRAVLQHERRDAFGVQPFRCPDTFVVPAENPQRAAWRHDHGGSSCCCGVGQEDRQGRIVDVGDDPVTGG
jgi:hypothetical protein